MTLYSFIFYLIAVLMVVSTAMAVTRRNLVHAVMFLVLSFFGSAMLFYLLGAPFLAALEIIIYAGAIMVLFLFIIMMIRPQKMEACLFPPGQATPALLLSAGFIFACGLLMGREPAGWDPMRMSQADPKAFGQYLFQIHWLTIEIASLLLLIALIGAYLLGRRVARLKDENRANSSKFKQETP